MNEIKDEAGSDGEACMVPQLGKYLFIDIKQEHCPTEPESEDQVRMI
jgi:hypothetical protein